MEDKPEDTNSAFVALSYSVLMRYREKERRERTYKEPHAIDSGGKHRLKKTAAFASFAKVQSHSIASFLQQ